MSRSRYRFTDATSLHFLTATVNNWLPVFTRPETVEILLGSWRFMQREAGLKIYGYVILENHLHMIASLSDLSRDMQRFKAWTAREILALLESRRSTRMLELLAMFKRRQKLQYIHQNPVKRGYVDRPEHWRYSSARDYLGQPGLIEIERGW